MSKRGWPHVDDPVSVGRRLKDARLAAGMSQRELSFPGCTAVYICRIERGDRVPSLQVLRELARRVGVSEEYLAMGSEAVAETDPLLDADVALRLGQFELAEHLYTQALERTTDRVQRGRALGGLGEIDFHAGRMDDAVERLEEARTLLADSIAGYAGIVDSLARVYWMRDEYEVAIAVLEEALGLARSRSDEQAEARFSVLLANVLIDSGSLSSARELLGKTLAKAAGATDPILQARLYWSQSRLHSAENNPEVAVRYARMALAAIELTDHTAYAARAHHLLAYIELERGNAAEALELLERGYPLAVSSGGADARGLFRLEKARALAALGRDEEAVVLAIEVAGELAEDRPEQAGRAYVVAADVFARLGERVRALELYGQAAEQLVTDRHPDFVREVYSKMAELLEEEGRKDEALELLKRAVGLQSQVPDTA
jgi:tetratricopeptide (TPR) repeat protein